MFSAYMMCVLALILGVLWFADMLFFERARRISGKEEPTYVGYIRGIFLILAFLILIRVFNISILTILAILTLASLVVWQVDRLIFAKKRQEKNIKEPVLVEYAHSLFPIFVIVLIIRAFIIQPFQVPTGSLEPTIMPDDFVAVSQFAYGLRLPITGTKVIGIGEPKTGDIAVFHYPVNPRVDFIKRVIGVPGDHIVYKDKVLYINGKEMKQTYIADGMDIEPNGASTPVKIMREDLNGVIHDIQVKESGGATADFDFVVPAGYYFMMGDNRDNSADSRVWGFVPEKYLVGKAFVIWMSWNHGIQWSRIGTRL